MKKQLILLLLIPVLFSCSPQKNVESQEKDVLTLVYPLDSRPTNDPLSDGALLEKEDINLLFLPAPQKEWSERFDTLVKKVEEAPNTPSIETAFPYSLDKDPYRLCIDFSMPDFQNSKDKAYLRLTTRNPKTGDRAEHFLTLTPDDPLLKEARELYIEILKDYSTPPSRGENPKP